jgi:hypothetical protein
MDSNRFDRLSRVIAAMPTRRDTARLLAGIVVGTMFVGDEGDAKKGKGKKKIPCHRRICPRDCTVRKGCKCKKLANGTLCRAFGECVNGGCVPIGIDDPRFCQVRDDHTPCGENKVCLEDQCLAGDDPRFCQLSPNFFPCGEGKICLGGECVPELLDCTELADGTSCGPVGWECFAGGCSCSSGECF